MKKLKDYILEAEEDENTESTDNVPHETNDKNTEGKDEDLNRRGDIKFTIWKEPDKKVTWLNDNEKYQKIEYKHEDKSRKMSMSFLLGYNKEKDTWQLWVGKIGGVTYDDDPLCDLKTNKFAKAIVTGLDKIVEYIKKVEEDPSDWIQYYKDI